MDKRKAFSVMEMLVVLAIFLVVVVEVSSFSSRWYLQNSLESTKNMLVSSLQKAQSYAISKKDNLTWGVCLTGNTIRMFGGSCASPTVKDDYTVASNVTVSGLSTVTFSTFRGEPNSAQSITLSGNNKTYTVTVNLVGGLDVN